MNCRTCSLESLGSRPQANAAKALRLPYLYRHADQNLVGAALAAPHWHWVFSISDGDIGFIHFHDTLQAFAPRTHHGAPESVQHHPRGLITAQAQYTL